MWVIFEGLDKTGKGTLEREFLKTVNYEHMVIDRGPVGYMVFDRVFNRCTFLRAANFMKYATQIFESKDYLVVYCFANKKIVDKRLKMHNETCPYDYDMAQEIYTSEIYKCYNPKRTLMLDTSYDSIEDCVKLIMKKLKEVQQSEL